MAEWQSGRVLVLQVQSRGFDPMSALTNYFFYLRRRPNVLQRGCFGSSPCGFCGTIGWHCGHCSAAYVMFKSISPSISGSRYPKKDTHQASRSLVEMNLHPASAGIRGSKPPGLRSEGSEGPKLRFLHPRSGHRRVSCGSFAQRLSHF